MSASPVWLLGGLGAPYDSLLAATLRGMGHRAWTLGPLDRDAHDRGRAVLPRSPCAPLLYTTGALLRTAEHVPVARYVGVSACGPCRFAAFPLAWRRALASAGRTELEVVTLPQDLSAFVGTLGEGLAQRLVEAVAAGDALSEAIRRLRPYVECPGELDHAGMRALLAMMRVLEAGAAPLVALRAVRRFHVELARRAPRAMGRVALVGEPWSLHTAGPAQLELPEVLGRAGLEVEVPPLSLWLALRGWEQRRARSDEGGEPVHPEGLERLTRRALGGAARAMGLSGLAIPDLDDLAALAAPYLPPEVRGGYGFVEIGLALRAARDRRAHAIVSVKSFGCIPSSGLADAIVPAALAKSAHPVPYLALEVSSDGDATRESRVMLRATAAQALAERELAEASARTSLPAEARAGLPVIDPHRSGAGPRPYACTLACAVAARGGATP